MVQAFVIGPLSHMISDLDANGASGPRPCWRSRTPAQLGMRPLMDWVLSRREVHGHSVAQLRKFAVISGEPISKQSKTGWLANSQKEV